MAESELDPSALTAFFLMFNDFQELFHSFKWHMEVLVREFPDIDRFLELMQACLPPYPPPARPVAAGGLAAGSLV